MIQAQKQKLANIASPQAAVDNASLTTASIDTKGWDYCQIVLQIGATDIAMTALKVQESDDDGDADAYADITGLDVDGDTDADGNTAVLPSATDDDNFVVFDIDLRGRERYLDLVATAGDGAAGTFMSAFAILSRGEDSPVTASERGAETLMRV